MNAPQISRFLLKNFLQPTLCFLLLMVVSHAAFSQSTYIYDPPGTFTGFTNVNNWDLEGSPSTHPTNFTDDNQIFAIEVTSQAVELDGDWVVSGSGSKVVIGDGVSGTTFTIPENFSYTGTIDVGTESTLTITNNTVPTMGSLASTSTVIYNENVPDPGNQIIASATYGDLIIRRQSPVKELQGDITVLGDLTFDDTEFTVTSAATLTLDGNLTLSQTVTFNANLSTNLDITHTGTSTQTITASSTTSTIPCNDFYSEKTSGSLSLASSPTTSLDIGGDFTIVYAAPAAFNDNGNSVNVDGTFTLEADADKNIPTGTYQNLTVNLSSGNGILQGAATVNGILTLTSGSIELGSNDLTISSGGSISGASSSKYIITNGGGELGLTSITGTQTYPIGTSGSYNPVTVAVSSGTPTISARVFGDVLTNGTSGSTVSEIDELVNRTWSVNSASSGFEIGLTFQWNDGEGGSAFAIGDGVKIIRYSGGNWNDLTALDMGVSGPPYSVSASNITSLSEFTLGDAGSTLPVTWLNFGGEEVYKGIASLKWKTASEVNNQGFEVQKSLDGKNFEDIGFVKGAGTTNEIQTYGFADEHLQQNAYYRLKQIDFDGKFDHSRIIFVESSQHIAHPFSVYPNPVRNTTPVNLVYQLDEPERKQPMQLQLYDMQGSLLLTANDTLDGLNEVLNARLGRMSQGMYVLTLSDAATLTHLKVLKQ